CKAIDDIEEFVVFDSGSQKYKFKDQILNAYCTTKENGVKGECDNESLKLSSSFIALLENFKSIDDEKSEDDKLAQYAILWLSYKTKQNPNIEYVKGTVYDILKQNNWFIELSEFIDDKKDIMGFHFLFLKRLYELLKGICDTINKCSDSSNSDECIKSAKKCSDLYRACIVQLPWAEICNPYCSVLSNLKKDYDKFRENNKNLPELTPPEGIKSCEDFCKNLGQRLYADQPTIEGTKQVTTNEISLPGPPVTPA
ncbi:Plasmodium variant antigen protein Cir/Yir/Bir, putative, partial [Plasmodium chabaudi chabaudi]